jgi:hypothetical protein
MKTDFTDYKFRCSSLGKLMTGVKPNLTDNQKAELVRLYDKRLDGKITDKQLITLGDLLSKRDANPELSVTTKSYLQELHAQELFGKKKEIQSKYLDKGIEVEEQSITLYSDVTGELFIKNKDRKENDFITGEPDNKQGKIRDIKSSWDLTTFPMHDTKLSNSDYYWQLQGYMQLFDLDESELIYCLVDTPEHLINDALYWTARKMNTLEGLPDELENEIRNNMTFSDIPKEIRCKVFTVERDRLAMKQLEEQIIRCREYMNQLSIDLGERLKDVA